MPDHSEKPTSPNPKGPPKGGKPRRRFRRFLKAIGLLLLLLAIFHRPILATAFRLTLIKIAARDNITLDLHLSGSFFTNLTVSDIRALPNGHGPTPVEKIVIRSVRLDYSIPRLIKQGIGAFLNSYEIDDADLVFAPTPSKTKKETEAKKSIAEDLNNVLGQPALYADLVKIENFNLVVHSGNEDTEIKGARLFFHPWQPGFVVVDRIHIPGLPEWRNVSAETSYAQRNLYVKDLVLSPEIVIDEFNFDASEKAQNRGSSMLNGRFFGGHAHFEVTGTRLEKKGKNLAKSYATTLQADAAGIDLQAAASYFHAKGLPAMRLAWLTASFTGEPENPHTWAGDLGVHIDALSVGKINVDGLELDAVFGKGQAQIEYGNATMGHTTVDITGTADLPESINDFSKTEADASFRISAPDLHELTAPVLPSSPLAAGNVQGEGKLGLHQRNATVKLNLSANQVAGSPYGIATVKLNLEAAKKLDATSKPLADLSSHVTAELSGLRLASFTADSATVDVETKENAITLHRVDVTRAENTIHLEGTYELPENGQDLLAAPLHGQFAIQAPKLDNFGIGVKDTVLGGHLNATGTLETAGHPLGGNIEVEGGDFQFGKFKAQTLNAKIGVKDNEATIDELRLQIDGKNQIAFSGKVGTQKPVAYEGAGLVLFTNLAVLQPLLEVFGVHDEISGSLDFSLEGNGKAQDMAHNGQVKLSLDKAKYGKIDIKEVRIAGLYGPGFAESSQLRVVSGATSFDGAIEWRENRLKLRDINLRQGTLQVLSGFVSIPFEPQNREAPIPFEKRIAANVNATQLDIEKLLAAFGQTAPAAGNVTANLVAGGTMLEPFANLKIAAKGLKAKAAAQFDPAELDVTAHYSEKELTLDVLARQRDIQPLTIKGRVPLDLQAAIQKKQLDPDLPLDVALKLPATSLAFLPKIVPSVRTAAGTVALDAHVGGTVGKPQLSGAASAKIDYARMKSEGVPAIGTLQANLAFTQNSLTVQQFRGEVGGGTFELGGKVLFPKISEPTFDLRLRSNSVLVKRDDSVTVRLDTDLAVTGPLPAGKIAGTVWVVQSRFFRDIDILPIALPGRPKPQPRSAPTPSSFSLGPPLSTWTFDIAVKTRPEDPFQIRGNLANGGAALDLKFGGTGKDPWLDGTIHIEKFVASLPFSKLVIHRGFITFTKDNGFVPKLDVSADSNLRDYHINAYIYGSATDPQLSLTSEPPLPQQDILSLLATGATSSELTGKNDVLASRAAVLLFQQLYRKIFKQKDPSENVPLLDRFNVEVGAVDSRTGREEVAATFKLGDQIYLVGDIDVTGAFTGRVKYLLRFR